MDGKSWRPSRQWPHRTQGIRAVLRARARDTTNGYERSGMLDLDVALFVKSDGQRWEIHSPAKEESRRNRPTSDDRRLFGMMVRV